MKKLLSKDIVATRKAALIDAIAALRRDGVVPKLVAVVCSDDPAALSYVSTKRKHTEEVGAEFEFADCSAIKELSDFERRIGVLGERADVDGVILVMSSKPEVDELYLTNLIPRGKDVDGLSAANIGALVQADPVQNFIEPATPRACMLLAETQTRLSGKSVAVIGRGRTVGKPLINMLINAGATVTVCHSRTVDLAEKSRAADVVFVATGQPHRFGRDCFRAGQVIIDAGIGFIDGKLVGDIDAGALDDLDVTLTPVPGGVGPLTSVLILENLLQLISFNPKRARTKTLAVLDARY